MFVPYSLETEETRRPWAAEALVGINIAIAAAVGIGDAEWIWTRWGFKPLAPSAIEATTSMFLHGHWLHLAGNMVFLWVFGRGLEREVGGVRFLSIYLASGWAAVVAHALFVAPTMSDDPAVGASGAISGVLGAVAVLMPAASVRCVYFPLGTWAPTLVEVAGGLFAVAWFAFQVVLAVFFSVPGVAVWAHVGGFAAGAALAFVLWGLPRLMRRRRERVWSRGLERAFAALCAGEAWEPPRQAPPASATADERWAAGWIAGRAPVEEGMTAASAYLCGEPAGWSGRETARAVAALAEAGLAREAAAAAGRFLEGHEGDPAEPELLFRVAQLLERPLGQSALAAAFRRALVERHPDSMQARQLRRTLTRG
jgi:membrane associated rhomboid family serine protease